MILFCFIESKNVAGFDLSNLATLVNGIKLRVKWKMMEERTRPSRREGGVFFYNLISHT